MKDAVNNISMDDEIFSITFRIGIITTSISLSFKYVEFDTIKREENHSRKK